MDSIKNRPARIVSSSSPAAESRYIAGNSTSGADNVNIDFRGKDIGRRISSDLDIIAGNLVDIFAVRMVRSTPKNTGMVW
jgi:hypothetical protein